MINEDQAFKILEACDERREARRSFLRYSSSAALLSGATLLSACGGGGRGDGGASDPILIPGPSPTPTPTPGTGALGDADILNFALNLEYLEAQFYSFAAFGTGLPDNILNGTGQRGQVTGGRQVPFTDQLVAQYAREIATDERNHVVFLRAALGASAVAQPTIDVGTGPNSAFSNAARASGLIGAGASFDAYANDENFLLAAFIFEDVGVTAYKGAAPLITSKTFLEAAAGILAAEAYHASLIRTVLYGKGLQTPSLRTATEQISGARDSLDDPSDKDQGVQKIGNMSNIVPVDGNGLAFSRSAGDVLNIVYLTAAAASQGGFFPDGVNGTIRLSTAG
ncbi:MAG TPA: ferritin-like domain-containing protein [Sphingomicrobium sp.]|nr:ferritin-like domain-containing protein [Sphingomicrobium sp.]